MKVLIALFAAATILIGVELALGAANAGESDLANPCRARLFKGDVVQRVVLAGVDHAACRLHTSREGLVLSLESASARREAALRAGLLRAVDEAEARGEIPGLLAGPVRELVRTAPIDKLIHGGISLSDLFSP
ncbi:MAG: hypothetical protein ACJ74B_09085 [Gaiellaceae bacterium]